MPRNIDPLDEQAARSADRHAKIHEERLRADKEAVAKENVDTAAADKADADDQVEEVPVLDATPSSGGVFPPSAQVEDFDGNVLDPVYVEGDENPAARQAALEDDDEDEKPKRKH